MTHGNRLSDVKVFKPHESTLDASQVLCPFTLCFHCQILLISSFATDQRTMQGGKTLTDVMSVESEMKVSMKQLAYRFFLCIFPMHLCQKATHYTCCFELFYMQNSVNGLFSNKEQIHF